MISDVLSDAVNEINRYLREYPDVYSGAIRERILEVVDVMGSLGCELDARPEL